MIPQRFWWVILLITLTALSVSAQNELRFNAPVIGQVAAGGDDRWQIIAREGQMLSFIATAADSDLDPILQVENSRGDTLIENDDYDYPNQSDALIEAFNVPRSGIYTVVVRGFRETSGEYRLTMLPGYSDLVLSESFTSDAAWRLAAPTDTPAEMTTLNNHLSLSQEGVNQPALALHTAPITEDTYHISAAIQDITGNMGWQVGIVLHSVDASNYTAVQINQQGTWRLVEAQNDTLRSIQDWTPHPALTAGQTDFTLGVLVNQSQYSIFYDGNFIGSVIDDNRASGQRIGVMVNSTNTVGSRVRAEYDQLLVTAPRSVNGERLMPSVLTSRGTNAIVRELERHHLIDTGGQLVLNITESNARYTDAGVSRVAIAEDIQPVEFVLGATVTWNARETPLTGCGFTVFDERPDDVYTLVYVDSQRGYGISQRDNDVFTQSVFDNTLDLGRPPYELLIVGHDDQIHYFLNAGYVGSITTDTRQGGIGEAVLNFERANTTCQFTNLWLWQVDTDS